MSKAGIKMLGIDELLKAFEKQKKETIKANRIAMTVAIKVALAQLQQNTLPFSKTQALHKSLAYRVVMSKTTGRGYAKAGPRANFSISTASTSKSGKPKIKIPNRYARVLEEGGKEKGNNQKAKWFRKRSFDQIKERMFNLYKATLKTKLGLR